MNKKGYAVTVTGLLKAIRGTVKTKNMLNFTWKYEAENFVDVMKKGREGMFRAKNKDSNIRTTSQKLGCSCYAVVAMLVQCAFSFE